MGSQLALDDPDKASGGIEPALETPSNPNFSEYLWVYSNDHLLKIIIYKKPILKESHTLSAYREVHFGKYANAGKQYQTMKQQN